MDDKIRFQWTRHILVENHNDSVVVFNMKFCTFPHLNARSMELLELINGNSISNATKELAVRWGKSEIETSTIIIKIIRSLIRQGLIEEIPIDE